METNYTKLAAINVNEHTEKKGNLTYLSWAWAVDQLLRVDPNATWEYGEPQAFGQTLMVFCTVTAFGKPMKMQLPVMDHRNKAIPNPDAFQVNTAMQRCLVKAIALHGLGLYIYAGEDLPDGEAAPRPGVMGAVLDDIPPLTPEDKEYFGELAERVVSSLVNVNAAAAYDLIELEKLDNEQKIHLSALLDSKTRSALKIEGGKRRGAA
jgi:hypothetical protein